MFYKDPKRWGYTFQTCVRHYLAAVAALLLPLRACVQMCRSRFLTVAFAPSLYPPAHSYAFLSRMRAQMQPLESFLALHPLVSGRGGSARGEPSASHSAAAAGDSANARGAACVCANGSVNNGTSPAASNGVAAANNLVNHSVANGTTACSTCRGTRTSSDSSGAGGAAGGVGGDGERFSRSSTPVLFFERSVLSDRFCFAKVTIGWCDRWSVGFGR